MSLLLFDQIPLTCCFQSFYGIFSFRIQDVRFLSSTHVLSYQFRVPLIEIFTTAFPDLCYAMGAVYNFSYVTFYCLCSQFKLPRRYLTLKNSSRDSCLFQCSSSSTIHIPRLYCLRLYCLHRVLISSFNCLIFVSLFGHISSCLRWLTRCKVLSAIQWFFFISDFHVVNCSASIIQCLMFCQDLSTLSLITGVFLCDSVRLKRAMLIFSQRSAFDTNGFFRLILYLAQNNLW